MTFAELKNLTAFWLDDLQFGYFTEAQLAVWLNNAQKRLQNRLIKAGENYYNKLVHTTLVVDQREYVLPDNFKDLMRLEVVISGTAPNESVSPLRKITLSQKDLVLGGRGTPLWYNFRRNRLVLLPAPDTALTMRMEYAYQVADMTLDSDIPDVPESYHELLALLACEDGFIKDGRANELLVKKIKEFNVELDSDAEERNLDYPRGVIETGNDATSGYFW